MPRMPKKRPLISKIVRLLGQGCALVTQKRGGPGATETAASTVVAPAETLHELAELGGVGLRRGLPSHFGTVMEATYVYAGRGTAVQASEDHEHRFSLLLFPGVSPDGFMPSELSEASAVGTVVEPMTAARPSFRSRGPELNKLWISESFGRHSSPLFWSALTFPLGLQLAMIQKFFPKAQRVAVFGGGLGT